MTWGGLSVRRVAVIGAWFALATPSPGFAQVYSSTERAQVFLPLSVDPQVSSTTPITFSSSDDGDALVSLPFTFRIWGETHAQVRVGTNGYLVFGGSRATSAFNRSLGSATFPSRVIAGWWDDLVLPRTIGSADTAVIGQAPNRVFVIEVRDLEDFPFSGQPEISLQFRLHEGAAERFELRFSGSPTEVYSASVGYIGPSGAPQAALRPCASTGGCTAADFAGLSGRAITVERAPGPDFAVALPSVPAGGLPGQSLPLLVVARNVGTETAPSPTEVAVYLSTDPVFDATDVEIGRVRSLDLAPGVASTRTATLTLPTGVTLDRYHLLARIDPDDRVTEPSETDNLVVTDRRFEVGYDLRLDVVEASVVAAAPSQSFEVQLDVSEDGLPFVGTVGIEVLASPNRVFSASDPVAFRGTVDVTRLPARLRVSAQVPVTGVTRFWPVARLDPDGRLPERSRTDLVRVADVPVLTGPDLRLEGLEARAHGVAGARLPVRFRVVNDGVSTTGTVQVELRASRDDIRDRSDPLLGQVTVPLSGISDQTVDAEITLPSLPPGRWYLTGEVDTAAAVVEVVETNNGGISVSRFSNAPNLFVERIDVPPVAAPGRNFTCTVQLGSDGVAFSGRVTQRWYLSEDRTLDPADIDLGTFEATFVGAQSLSVQPAVTLPVTLPPVDWYVLVAADANAAVVEADELDNLGVSRLRTDGRRNLRVSTLRLDSTAVDPSGNLAFAYQITSFSAPYDGPAGVRAWLSRDRSLGAGDIAVSTTTVTLGDNRTDLAGTVTIPTASVPGPSYLVLEVDPSDAVVESREDDNIRVSSAFQIRGPDLAPEGLSAPSRVVAGEGFMASFVLANLGTFGTTAARYRYEVLASGGTPRTLARVGPIAVDAGMRRARSDALVMPADISGLVELAVVADADGQLAELEEGNNRLVVPIEVPARLPDLRPVLVRAATVAAAGEPWSVEVVVENRGLAPATAEMSLTLGTTSVATATITLAVGESRLSLVRAELPATLPPGRYPLRLQVDPRNLVVELDESNELPGPEVEILPASLRVLTTQLPIALTGRRFEVLLAAAGGRGAPQWRFVGPGPSAFTLAPNGLLSGLPVAAGDLRFVVRVEVGSEFAEQEFLLRIRDAAPELLLVTKQVPPAWVGESYRANLVAAGGTPPLLFSAAGVPVGLSVSPDGIVSGTGVVTSRGQMRITVRDAEGRTATGPVILAVLDDAQRLVIAPTPLPPARLSREYCATDSVQLFAAGGVEPLQWRAEGLPPGLELGPGGVLCGRPTALGVFSFEVFVDDAVGGTDSAQMAVEVVSASTLVWRAPAVVSMVRGSSVRLVLAVEGGVPPLRFQLGAGVLPAGLQISEAGILEGQPEATGLFPLVVQVVDGEGSADNFAFALEVSTAPGAEGCRCAELRPRPVSGVMALVLLVGLILRNGSGGPGRRGSA